MTPERPTGHRACAPEEAQAAHALIRRCVGRLYDGESARALVIQYGGSVEPENAAALLGRPGVDGALVGGASLRAAPFLAIVLAGRVPQCGEKPARQRRGSKQPRCYGMTNRRVGHRTSAGGPK